MHIDVGRGYGFLRKHGPAELLEVVPHHSRELLRVGAAVVDGHDLPGFQDIVNIFGVRGALVDIAVHRAHIAVVFRLAVRRGQLRRRGRGSDVGDPRLPENRRAGRRGAGAGGSQHDHRVGVRGQLRRRGLAAFGVAAVILGVQLDGVADQRAALILDGDFDAALLVDAERRIGAGHHPIGADLDRGALGDRDHAEVIRDRSFGFGCCSRSSERRQSEDCAG